MARHTSFLHPTTQAKGWCRNLDVAGIDALVTDGANDVESPRQVHVRRREVAQVRGRGLVHVFFLAGFHKIFFSWFFCVYF